ncbi:MAG TPA: trigger factor [Vicinamibacteria bacterium]|nr:trigger factor [Vicinamibacteria bacterium]
MKVEYVEETSVRKSLNFEIDAEVVEKEIETRARDYARKVKLPGFRPGKVPTEVIKRRFRDAVLGDAAESIVNRVVFEELEGRGLRPLASPKVQDLKIDENQPMTFRAVFETLPLVEVPDYRGLAVKARRPEVKDEDVDREVDRMRDEAARYDAVEDRPARQGDHVVLDVKFKSAEGKPRHDESVLVEVGAEDNHRDLSAGLVGMTPGETKQIRLVQEEAQVSPPRAERAVEYTVTLKAIKTKVVPAADDEFAKDLGEFASLSELRDKVRGQLQAAEDHRADRDAKNALVDALVGQATFEVPEALVERHMMARTEHAARGLALQGIDPTKLGMDWRQYRDSQRDESLKAAKADILLDEIARREGIEVLDAELDAEVARLAERLRKPKETVRKQMEQEGDLGALRARIREDKTLDLLKANARLDVE